MDRRPILALLLGLLPFAPGAEPRLATAPDGGWRLPDSSVYTGPLSDGLFAGEGHLRWRNGAHYRGHFRDGLFHGQGRLEGADGSVYEGMFRDGLPEGRGVYTDLAGNRYEGEFRKGLFHGEGRLTEAGGTVFAGRFAAGVPDGPGEIRYADGTVYTGEIRHWQRHGEGEYRISDDLIFRGSFVEDSFDGEGEILQDGDHYRGRIHDWRPEGPGQLVRRSGEIYVGEFHEGHYHGHGLQITADGDIYEGAFRNGLRHGEGTYWPKSPHGHKRRLHGYWFAGRYTGDTPFDPEAEAAARREREQRREAVNAEATFYRQPELLQRHLAKLQPGTPGVIDIYLLSFGAWGDQDVFMHEASLARELFETRFEARGRTVTLINNPHLVRSLPLASVTNLERALARLAEVMDEEDILVLYLTSHGTEDHALAVGLADLPLDDLPATRLGELLARSGIRWKVVIVSACYSGGFIEPLDDGRTLVMTSAAADRVSFGCSDEAELTYFGRALLRHGLATTHDFGEAWRIAADRVREWEAAEEYDHSRPRLHYPPAIAERLATWRRQHRTTTAMGAAAQD